MCEFEIKRGFQLNFLHAIQVYSAILLYNASFSIAKVYSFVVSFNKSQKNNDYDFSNRCNRTFGKCSN